MSPGLEWRREEEEEEEEVEIEILFPQYPHLSNVHSCQHPSPRLSTC
jgi:hypothetical protein